MEGTSLNFSALLSTPTGNGTTDVLVGATGTTNGGLDVDFPVTLQGRIDRKHLTFDVGKGGPLVRAMTTNGGVEVRKR